MLISIRCDKKTLFLSRYIIPALLYQKTSLPDNNYLLTGNKVQLYFTENNSRYFICRAKRDK